MTVQSLIKSKPYLCWYVKDKAKLSDSAVVEAVLNYGDWGDINKMLKILGTKRVTGIFHKQISRNRCNYNQAMKDYFPLYFSGKMPKLDLTKFRGWVDWEKKLSEYNLKKIMLKKD